MGDNFILWSFKKKKKVMYYRFISDIVQNFEKLYFKIGDDIFIILYKV